MKRIPFILLFFPCLILWALACFPFMLIDVYTLPFRHWKLDGPCMRVVDWLGHRMDWIADRALP